MPRPPQRKVPRKLTRWRKQTAAYTSAWLLLLPAFAQANSVSYATHGDERLAALIGEALERNPGIREAVLDSQAARHRVRQATAWPDPTLSFTWNAEPPETRTGPQRGGIALSQNIPWFGQLADQGTVASKLADAGDAAVAMRRADVIRQVKWAYYELAYLDRAVALATREEEVLDLHESLARAHYAQGIGLQQAVVRLQAEITRALSNRDGFLQRRTEVEAALNELRDRSHHEGVAEARLGSLPAVQVDEDRLRQLARTGRPEVKAARLRIASDEGKLRLAQRERRPDLTLGAAWGAVSPRRDEAGRLTPPPDNGKDTASLTLGITLPLSPGRYRAGEREAAARLDSAKAAYRRTVNEAHAQVRTASVRLAMTGERIARFENVLLPQTEQAQRSAEAGYAAGTLGVLELLESEQALIDARLGLARLKSDYMQALADMERAVGTAFPEDAS